MHQLRDYQQEIIEDIESAIAQGYRRIMLQLPTGAGKTRCFVELAKRHRAKPYIGHIPNCLIVAHRKELIDQAVKALEVEMGSKWEIGIIRSQVEANPYRAIQVASIQSLIRRDFPRAGLVIIDEAHHAKAKSYQTIINHYGEAIILGVTATPARTDGQGFRDCFQILIKGPTVKNLTAQKYLCPYKLYAYTRQKINTNSVRIQAGDYLLNELADAVMDSQVRADLVQTWEKHAFGKRTVVFAVSVELSKEYAAIYKASGYKAEHIDGNTPEYERTAILNRFKQGETKILCNCNIVTEGFDLPEMECVQVVRPTQSLVFWLQMVGRSLRISQGKSHAIILDHTDNYKRLNLPDSDRNWTLSGVKATSFVQYFSGNGSNEYERRRRELQHIEGELIEIYSNSQEIENTDMEKVTIDNVEYEVTRPLAKVIRDKLSLLGELEDLLSQKDDDVVDCQVYIYNLEVELNKKQEEIIGFQELIEELQIKNDDYKEKLEVILEEITTLHQNKDLSQNILQEFDVSVNNNKFEEHETENDSGIESNDSMYCESAAEKYALKDYHGSIFDYTKAVQINPNNASTYNNRGVAKYALGDKHGAIVDYTKAIQINSNNINDVSIFYSNRGVCKSDLGDKEGTIADCTEAIRLNTNNSRGYEYRGIAMFDLGYKDEALANLKKAAILFHKLENTEHYQQIIKRIEKIEKQSR